MKFKSEKNDKHQEKNGESKPVRQESLCFFTKCLSVVFSERKIFKYSSFVLRLPVDELVHRASSFFSLPSPSWVFLSCSRALGKKSPKIRIFCSREFLSARCVPHLSLVLVVFQQQRASFLPVTDTIAAYTFKSFIKLRILTVKFPILLNAFFFQTLAAIGFLDVW